MIAILNKQASKAASDVVNAVKELLDATDDSNLPIPSDELSSLCNIINSAKTGFPLRVRRMRPAINKSTW